MNRFKYGEKVILKSDDSECKIEKVSTDYGSRKTRYLLDNGKNVNESDIEKYSLSVTDKLNKSTRKAIEAVSDLSEAITEVKKTKKPKKEKPFQKEEKE